MVCLQLGVSGVGPSSATLSTGPSPVPCWPRHWRHAPRDTWHVTCDTLPAVTAARLTALPSWGHVKIFTNFTKYLELSRTQVTSNHHVARWHRTNVCWSRTRPIWQSAALPHRENREMRAAQNRHFNYSTLAGIDDNVQWKFLYVIRKHLPIFRGVGHFSTEEHLGHPVVESRNIQLI